jgi:putative transcriptional regulator
MIQYKGCGLPNVFLQNGYTKVDSPYGEGVSIHDVPGLHKAIADHVVCASETLSGAEFRFLRMELDLSQEALGALIGRDQQSIARWEKGRTKVDPAGDRILRALYKGVEGGRLRAFLTKLQNLEAALPAQRIVVSERKKAWTARAAAA